MKWIISLLLVAGRLFAATTSGTITTDETWTGTVTLTGNVTVAAGKLTIEPGTTVKGSVNDLKITGPGIIYAVGEPGNRINFRGFKFIIEALENDSLCRFEHCYFRGNYCLLEFRNPKGVTEQSDLRFDHCEFERGGYTLLYVTSGGNPTITNSIFHDAKSGIFLHGGDDVSVTNCKFYDVGCGIINASMEGWILDLTVNHCVFHRITMDGPYNWALGFAIRNLNQPGTLTVHNSIFRTVAMDAIKDMYYSDTTQTESWVINEDYNCFYRTGAGPVDTFAIGPNSIELDPLLTLSDSADFSLQAGSPCIGAASDGGDMGLWAGVGVADEFLPTNGHLPVRVSANPFRNSVTFDLADDEQIRVTIFDRAGDEVGRLQGNGRITWDGRNAQAGVYVAVVRSSSGAAAVRVVKVE